MIVLWIAAALFSALAAAFIIYRASGAAAMQPGEDPALAVYRRQLSELDDLAERGLLPAQERGSAHTEAARRLLAAADQARPSAPMGLRSGRLAVVAVATAIPLAAAAIYLLIGSPRTPDQPFAKRLEEWRGQDPATLSPQQLSALLEQAVVRYPTDPNPLYYLARTQAASGDVASAEHSLRKALALAPKRADIWSYLGALTASQSEGEPSDDALQAFRQALALDPNDLEARYYVARARIGAGDVAGGLSDWRSLAAGLEDDDPRKAIMATQIAIVDKTRALPVAEPAAAPPAAAGDQQAFIRSMVDGLAARLKAQPDDPAGWARLVRSYGVLGDRPAQDAALARARALFKDRPRDLGPIEAAAGAPQ